MWLDEYKFDARRITNYHVRNIRLDVIKNIKNVDS